MVGICRVRELIATSNQWHPASKKRLVWLPRWTRMFGFIPLGSSCLLMEVGVRSAVIWNVLDLDTRLA